MKETVERTGTGAILYDRSLLNHVTDEAFDAAGWPRVRAIEGRLRSGGRGHTFIVGDGERELVLKHYVRGGLPGRFVHDRYLWRGEARVRSFGEWRLLVRLRDLGLPVPRPCAARYRRDGAWYTADLLTVRMPGIEPLSSRIARAADGELWRSVGRGLRRFHDAGVFHADLNAYNVQLDREGGIVLLDFDRGEIRAPGTWQRANLARLARSLHKLKRLDPALAFTPADWASLLEAYEGR